MVEKEELNIDSEKLDIAWKVFQNNQELIRFADQKVGFLLVISGVLTSFVFESLSEIKALKLNGYISLGIFLVIFGFFILFSVKSLFARPSTKTGNNVPKLIYFGHIVKRKEAAEYHQDFWKTTEVELIKDLTYQIYEIACIAETKYKNYKIACWILGGQFLAFVNLMWRITQ